MNEVIIVIILLSIISIFFAIAFFNVSNKNSKLEYEKDHSDFIKQKCLFCNKKRAEHKINFFYDYDDKHFFQTKCMAKALFELLKTKK